MQNKTEAAMGRAEQVLYKTYNRFPVMFDHGKGVYLYDAEGTEYLDFGAGIAVCALGQIAGDLLEVPKLSGLLGALGSAAKMALAVLCSIFCVTVVTAAVVLFVKGSL